MVKQMNKKDFLILCISSTILVATMLFGAIHFCKLQNSQELQTYTIVDKHEAGERCFVEVQIEVSPEEYIGYEIGDEFAVD